MKKLNEKMKMTSMFLHYCLGPLVIKGNTGAFTQIGKIS